MANKNDILKLIDDELGRKIGNLKLKKNELDSEKNKICSDFRKLVAEDVDNYILNKYGEFKNLSYGYLEIGNDKYLELTKSINEKIKLINDNIEKITEDAYKVKRQVTLYGLQPDVLRIIENFIGGNK